MSITRFSARAPKQGASGHVPPNPGHISFGGGYAFADLLPDISDIAADAARNHRVDGLQYGPLMGLDELRKEIVRFLAEDGVRRPVDNILIVHGARQAIDLALDLFLDPGDPIVVTRPNYSTALGIFRKHQATFVEVGIDANGMDVDELEAVLGERRRSDLPMPKILYTVPDFHNPTGATMSLARRQKLLELADAFDFMVIEDDPYRRINFGGQPIPPIQSLDKTGRVIGVGTVSKIFAPGIRIGWACASHEIVGRMAAMKSDSGCSPFVQRIVAMMLKSGRIADQTTALKKELKLHRDVMAAALRRHLPEAKFVVPNGGYYMWIELAKTVDGDALAAAAERSGVTIFSGVAYFANRTPRNFIRLCYSNSTPAEIDRGIEILGDVIHRIANDAQSETPAARVGAR